MPALRYVMPNQATPGARRRGRPVAADPRRHAVTCRLTDAERQRVDACRMGMTRGEWLRRAALATIPRPIPAINLAAWAALARAAGNLNQLAHAVNAAKLGGHEMPDTDEIRAMLSMFRCSLVGASPASDQEDDA